MRRLPALVAALLLPAAQPLLLGAMVSTASLLVSEAPTYAQSEEAIGKVAQAITVRIEGATQGSGVLVKRDGNRYTVLTAWHVVSGQRPGEELDIYTFDGLRYPLEQGSTKRLGQVDMAVLTFSSSASYEVARVGDVKSVSSGSSIAVSGFPLPTSAVPTRIFRLIKGDVIANATVAIPDGYQLLYDNQTLPGVSGGAVLNAKGELVGIHGKAEKADQISMQSGKAIATGTNQGVPISYYSKFALGENILASALQPMSVDDRLAQARNLLRKKGREQEAIELSNQALKIQKSSEAYFYRAYAKSNLGDNKGAIEDFYQAVALNPKFYKAYLNLGYIKYKLGDKQGALAEFNQAISINPESADAYMGRSYIRSESDDKYGALDDIDKVISIDPTYDDAYQLRGGYKTSLGDIKGAIADLDKAITVDPKDPISYYNRGLARSVAGERYEAIDDYTQAIALSSLATKDKQLQVRVTSFYNRGDVKLKLGDRQGAIADFTNAIEGNQQLAIAWGARGLAKVQLGDRLGGCQDLRKSASLGSTLAQNLLPRICQ